MSEAARNCAPSEPRGMAENAFDSGVSEGIRQGVEQERARVRAEVERKRDKYRQQCGDVTRIIAMTDLLAWLDAPATPESAEE